MFLRRNKNMMWTIAIFLVFSFSTVYIILFSSSNKDEPMPQISTETQTKETTPLSIHAAQTPEEWLAVIKPDIEVTTFSGYEMNVTRVIAPYFRNKGTRLKDLTAADINYFYSEQLKRVSGTTVQHYHANIHSALKYALANDLMTTSSILGKIKRPKASPFVGQFLSQSEVVELFEKIMR